MPPLLLFPLFLILILVLALIFLGYSLPVAIAMAILTCLGYLIGGVFILILVLLCILLYRPIQGLLDRLSERLLYLLMIGGLLLWLVLAAVPFNPPGLEWAFLALVVLVFLNLKKRSLEESILP
jgi:hypothetical protein